MEVTTSSYAAATGWSSPLPTAMDDPRTLVLAFGATSLADDPRPLDELVRAFPSARRIGCSTSGSILGDHLVEDRELVVAIARFHQTDLVTASATLAGRADSYAAGRSIGTQLAGPGLRAMFVCSDGLAVNGSELVRGINGAVEPSVLVTGGMAGDGTLFRRTWVIDAAGAPRGGIVTAVGLYGQGLRLGCGSAGGWDSVGPERRITRSVGNVVYEIDGKPALDLYKRYLGERAAGLPATALFFPLAIRAGPDDPNRILRSILAVDEAARSMTFAGDVPQGHRAQLMRTTLEHLIDGATAAAVDAAFERPDDTVGATLTLAVSCVGRRWVLGERTEEELEVVASLGGPAARQVGFYSYGEICPVVRGRPGAELHNETMTVTRIGEAAARP